MNAGAHQHAALWSAGLQSALGVRKGNAVGCRPNVGSHKPVTDRRSGGGDAARQWAPGRQGGRGEHLPNGAIPGLLGACYWI